MKNDRDAENSERLQENIESKGLREGSEAQIKAYQQEKRFENAKDFSENKSEISEIKDVREEKSRIIEDMVTKDYPVSPEKRFDNAKDFHYHDKNEFSEEFRKRESSISEQDIAETEGFYDSRDNQAFIKEQGDTFSTAIHEKLHQKSGSELPTRLNEGITEYFASKEAGAIGELKNIDSHGREIPKNGYYEKEVEIVGKLDALVGESPLHAAYFEGKTEVLRANVDSVLGDGSFDTITEALERGDYESASDIIDKNKKQ